MAKKSTAYVDKNKSLTGYEKSLSEYTIRELKALASKYQVPRYGSLTSSQLVEAISSNENYIKANPKSRQKRKGGLEEYIRKRMEGSSSHSSSWYRQHVFEYLSKNETLEPAIGKMYFFRYDAKFKNVLPRWDVFPLIFLLSVKDGDSENGGAVIGANVHYLSGEVRLKMVKSFLNKRNPVVPKQTLHMYLMEYLDSFFLEVDEEDWEFIASLPLEKFIEK